MKFKFTIIAAASLFSAVALAQQIPDDSSFRKGTLENGLTYYLYHNEKPAGCADFFIAHNVGALLEEDNQDGLAHFLEHMAFNGLKHYPGSQMLDFLAGEGVRFGYNVNAYTSRYETVYNISKVPLVRESFVDSVLMVLHDWSSDISCQQEALDAERGVISEEWRLRDEPRWRMMCRQTELVYKGGKQPLRTVIGSYDVINGFKREEILDFYDKWYRPDLQAIVVTGDFDVDAMEAKVRGMFSDITMPENAPEKPASFMPPAQDGVLYGDMLDPTIKYQAVKLIYKQPYPSREQCGTEEYVRDFLCRQITSSLFDDRLKEAVKDTKCPARSAVMVTNAEVPNFYVSLLTATPRSLDNFLDGSCFEAMLTEVRRFVLHGISREEVDHAKFMLMQRLHLDRRVDASEVDNTKMAQVCLDNFLHGTPLVHESDMQDIQLRLLGEISYEELAKYPAMMYGDAEIIYSNCCNVSLKDQAPKEEQMREVVARVAQSSPEPRFLSYEKFAGKVEAVPGTIVRRSAVKGHSDLQKWELSNGVKVFYCHTAPARTGVHMAVKAIFPGGMAMFDPAKVTASRYAFSYVKRNAGFCGMDYTTLRGQQEFSGVSCLLGAGEHSSTMSFTATGTAGEKLFQTLYFKLTDPYFGKPADLDRFSLVTLKNLAKGRRPKEIFEEDAQHARYGMNPWMERIDSAAVEAVNVDFVADVYKRCYGNVGGMTLIVCGDLDQQTVEDYICRYVASIEAPKPAKPAAAHPAVPVYRGVTEYRRENPVVTEPFSDVSYMFDLKVKDTPKLRVGLEILDYIMSARYIALIREERGGAYHVGFTSELPADSKAAPLTCYVDFHTRPELCNTLVKDVEEELLRFCQSGPTAAEMDKAVKYLRKYHKDVDRRKSVSPGMKLDDVVEYVRYGHEYAYEYNKVLESVDAAYVQALARRVDAADKFIKIYEEKEK